MITTDNKTSINKAKIINVKEFNNIPKIEVFISNFKNGFNHSELIECFTSGNCYHFSVILNNLYNGQIVYDAIIGHFMFEYKSNYYDITGKTNKNNIKNITIWNTDNYFSNQLQRMERDCVYKIK